MDKRIEEMLAALREIEAKAQFALQHQPTTGASDLFHHVNKSLAWIELKSYAARRGIK